ncbi:hypothetical protein C8F04DRAFT_1327629 [Mycena alexandri]|uniref:Uncharacterized protein n=1 Tax=Mycena alexandri TaxID=1745969 RepID=A0AAD6X5Z6_9AGAR|nr:hypothetical protein C8F04DRAFT_1327629 [Mycena alexandri]
MMGALGDGKTVFSELGLVTFSAKQRRTMIRGRIVAPPRSLYQHIAIAHLAKCLCIKAKVFACEHHQSYACSTDLNASITERPHNIVQYELFLFDPAAFIAESQSPAQAESFAERAGHEFREIRRLRCRLVWKGNERRKSQVGRQIRSSDWNVLKVGAAFRGPKRDGYRGVFDETIPRINQERNSNGGSLRGTSSTRLGEFRVIGVANKWERLFVCNGGHWERLLACNGGDSGAFFEGGYKDESGREIVIVVTAPSNAACACERRCGSRIIARHQEKRRRAVFGGQDPELKQARMEGGGTPEGKVKVDEGDKLFK